VEPEKFLKAGISGMLGTLDPYTNLVEKEEKEQLDILTNGSYGGVGLVLMYRNNIVTVAEPPFLGTPAAKAGIREGDQIVSVNGSFTKDLGFEKTVQQIRGLRGTEVVIAIQREGEEKLLEFTLIREQIRVEDVTYSGKVSDGIGYIVLTRFSKNADSEMSQAVQKLKSIGCHSLVLDLRSNPGGMLEAAVGVSELFLQKNATIVSTKGRTPETDQVFKSVKDPLFKDGRMIVLVNEGSASASEIVAGAIQDHDRGIVLGDTTFGKGLVQTVVSLTATSVLKITTSKYYTPSGRCIQKRNYSQWEDSTDMDKNAVYKTEKGRVVHAGGGIIPDMVIREADPSDMFYDLVRKAMFFNFAVFYSNTHAKPDSDFQVTDGIMGEFKQYLKQKSYGYKHPIEKSLENLKTEAVKGGYQTDVLRDVQALENTLTKAKEDMFANSSKDIKRALRLELSSKYFGSKKQIESSLQDDPVFQKALALLKDQVEYTGVLEGKTR
jgi:carboxyl-terminal processing protease